MRRSRGFASTAPNLGALFGLAFASASRHKRLTSLVTVSRRIIMQKARDQAGAERPIALSPLVGVWFQVHYPPLVGVLPIFRSRYWCAIGRQGVLSLGRWASRIQAGFHVSGPTQVPGRRFSPSPTGLSPASVEHSRTVRLGSTTFRPVLQPRPEFSGRFGLVRFRSPLLTESRFLSFPPGTEMFQFSGLVRASRNHSPFDGSSAHIAVFHALSPGAKASPTRP